MEVVILAINIVLFPDLRFDATERNSRFTDEFREDIEEEGAYFPDIISTIGFTICRPLKGTYLSVHHKRGFDDVVISLLYYADRCAPHANPRQ